jgi:uncharacterized protein YtpQ (UPF0354 family)
MASFPSKPEDFAAFVKKLFLRNWPERKFEIAGPMDLVIDGRHLGLENLWRIARQDPSRAEEVIESYIDKLLEGDSVGSLHMPFALVRNRIMPRIQPESIFQHLDREQVAHVPFVNGTVVVFVIDMPHVTVSVTVEQMVRWGVQVDDLERLARENLARYAPELKVRVVETEDGGKAAIVALQDGYDAARLLLESLHLKLAPQLGVDFFVATPARDMLVAMSCNPPNFVQRISQRIDRDYQRLPYPITSALFLVTRDGVAGTVEEAA